MNRFAKMKKERIYTLFETLSFNDKNSEYIVERYKIRLLCIRVFVGILYSSKLTFFVNSNRLLIAWGQSKNKTTYFHRWLLGDLGGTRTHGPLIKSQLLYQLSYEVFPVASGFNRFAGANMQQYFLICKKIIL